MAVTRREVITWGPIAIAAGMLLASCGAQTKNKETDIPKRSGPPFEGSVITEGQATDSTFYKSIDGTVAELPNVPIQITAGNRQATINVVHKGTLRTQNIPEPGSAEWIAYENGIEAAGGFIIDPTVDSLQNCNGYTLKQLGFEMGPVWVEHSPTTENFFANPDFFEQLPHSFPIDQQVDKNLAAFAQPNDVLLLYGPDGTIVHSGVVANNDGQHVYLQHKLGEGQIIQTPSQFAVDVFADKIASISVKRPIPNP
jgi:hypothetical protein